MHMALERESTRCSPGTTALSSLTSVSTLMMNSGSCFHPSSLSFPVNHLRGEGDGRRLVSALEASMLAIGGCQADKRVARTQYGHHGRWSSRTEATSLCVRQPVPPATVRLSRTLPSPAIAPAHPHWPQRVCSLSKSGGTGSLGAPQLALLCHPPRRVAARKPAAPRNHPPPAPSNPLISSVRSPSRWLRTLVSS